jgi:hypothetical protein
MAFKDYDFRQHFDLIADVLGEEVTYDNLSLNLDSRLFLRNEKDGNYAQIVYLTNNRFRVILCLNKMGCIVHTTSKSFEKCVYFLKDNAFISTDTIRKWKIENTKIKEIKL